jgi:hypothetical protein
MALGVEGSQAMPAYPGKGIAGAMGIYGRDKTIKTRTGGLICGI